MVGANTHPNCSVGQCILGGAKHFHTRRPIKDYTNSHTHTHTHTHINHQVSKGIRQLMYIPNNNTQNDPFCRLQLVIVSFEPQLNEPTNQNSIKVPKVYEPAIIKSLLSNFGDLYKKHV